MIAQTYLPAAPLSDFIQVMWYQDGYQKPSIERVLPDGSATLILNLCEDRLPIFQTDDPTRFYYSSGSLFYGAHSEIFVINTALPMTIVGVQFKPGGAFPFFTQPGDTLRNQIVPLDVLWGRLLTDELRDRLLTTSSIRQLFQIMEQFLLHQLRMDDPFHPAVRFALSQFQNGRHTVASVTNQIGLSQRHFIQHFRQEVGLTPKLFCRLQRFQHVTRLIQKKQVVHWADVALTCGYFDQAHFIHDFQTFSGLNPTAYFDQRSDRPNHVIF